MKGVISLCKQILVQSYVYGRGYLFLLLGAGFIFSFKDGTRKYFITCSFLRLAELQIINSLYSSCKELKKTFIFFFLLSSHFPFLPPSLPPTFPVSFSFPLHQKTVLPAQLINWLGEKHVQIFILQTHLSFLGLASALGHPFPCGLILPVSACGLQVILLNSPRGLNEA